MFPRESFAGFPPITLYNIYIDKLSVTDNIDVFYT